MAITVTGFPASDPVPAIRFNVLVGQGARSSGSGARSICLVAPRAVSVADVDLGTATDAQLYPLSSADEAASLFGSGSSHHRMMKKIMDTWPGATVYGISAANGTAVSGVSDTVLGAGPVVVGEMVFWVGDSGPYSVASVAAEAVDDFGARIETNLNLVADLPVTLVYTAGTNTLSWKAKQPGADATGIKWRCVTNTTGVTLDGATLDSGTLAAGADGNLLTATTGGLVVCYDAIQASDIQFTYILEATHTTATIQTAGCLQALIEDCCTADVGKRMHAILGQHTTQAAATTQADALDGGTVDVDEGAFRFQIVWASYNEAQPWEIAAVACAVRAEAESSNINGNWIGFSGASLPNLVPCVSTANYPTGTQFTSCINGGVSPVKYDSEAQTCTLVRSITCKWETPEGNPDYRARDTNIIAVSDYVCADVVNYLTDTYDGFTITDDVDDAPPDNLASYQTTPSLIRQSIYQRLKSEHEGNGRIANVDDHFDALVVERNASNSQRVDAEVPVEVVRWLVQMGGNVREIGS